MSFESYTLGEGERTITCKRCGLTSPNRDDVLNRFCPKCDVYHRDVLYTEAFVDGNAVSIWIPPLCSDQKTELSVNDVVFRVSTSADGMSIEDECENVLFNLPPLTQVSDAVTVCADYLRRKA